MFLKLLILFLLVIAVVVVVVVCCSNVVVMVVTVVVNFILLFQEGCLKEPWLKVRYHRMSLPRAGVGILGGVTGN